MTAHTVLLVERLANSVLASLFDCIADSMRALWLEPRICVRQNTHKNEFMVFTLVVLSEVASGHMTKTLSTGLNQSAHYVRCRVWQWGSSLHARGHGTPKDSAAAVGWRASEC